MNYFKFILIYFLIKFTASEYEPAYLKVCSKGIKQSIESIQCAKGIWLRTSIQPGCLCVRGVWAISNGFCDNNAVLLVGDGHCYHIPFEIRTAKLIGDPRDPFKPKIYVTPSTFDAVYEVHEGNFTPTILSEEAFVIGINPRQVAKRRGYDLCIDLKPSEYGKPLHIFMNPRRMANEWMLDKKKEYSCPTTTPYQHHVAFGEMFRYNKIEPQRLVERHCKQECPDKKATMVRVQVSKPTIGRSLTMKGSRSTNGYEGSPESNMDPRGEFLVAGKASTSLLNKKSGRKTPTKPYQLKPYEAKPFKTMEERQEEREEMRANTTQPMDDYEKEVNEQTLRMMHAHISPLLLTIPGPQVITREYRYFQKIRLVTEKVCPEEYVPHKILIGLMRMFRQLLWETQDTFHHIETGDDGQFNRTLGRLAECAERTKAPALLYNSYTESRDPQDNSTEPRPERCPPIIYAINSTLYNRTSHGEQHWLRNYTYLFPPHLKYNESLHDFVIECAWKITMIGHYRCSKYFDDETAIDFSHFFHQVQSFFNHRIIKRWYYQKSVNATLKIVKMIFPSYDLKKFMFGLDTCLTGTQIFSHYDKSKFWIQRPKISHSKNDLSQDKYIVPGSSLTPLSTRDYSPDQEKVYKPNTLNTASTKNTTDLHPPKMSSSPPSKSKSKKTKHQKERGYKQARGKRDVTMRGFHMWDERARCLNNYLDPVLNNDFGYRLPSDCLIPLDPLLSKKQSLS